MGLPFHLGLFVFASVLVWVLGGRLSLHAKVISERTRFGEVLVGALLLGAVASLPELVMSLTGAALGDARLAVGTLLGGIPVTMIMVAVADAVLGGGPLTRDVTHPLVLLQGILVIVHLCLLGGVIVLGDVPILGLAGVGGLLLTVVYLPMILLLRGGGEEKPWIVKKKPKTRPPSMTVPEADANRPLGGVILRAVGAGAGTVVGGYLLAVSGEAISQETGVGSSLVGFLLGGISTTLPELVTILYSVRLGKYEMAFGDAFGTNLFSIMIVGLADLVYGGGPILNQAGRFNAVAALLGALLTAIYLGGLVRRSRRTVLRFGVDSALALGAYAIGVVLLSQLS